MENKTSCKSCLGRPCKPVVTKQKNHLAGQTATFKKIHFTYPRSLLSGNWCWSEQQTPDRITRGKMDRGFTLIELLVVVLIIGILASIALPQYQKAVEKSKAAQALTVLNSYYQAYQAYYMSEGSAPGTLDVLPVNMPWSGTEVWASTNPVGKAVSNEDWAVQIYTNSEGFAGMCAGRLRGEYKGAGFCKFRVSPREDIKTDTLYCAEKKNGHGILFQKNKGDYCRKIWKGTYVAFSTFHFFALS